MRRDLNDNPILTLDTPVELVIKTKHPSKWIIVDSETGEVYEGTANSSYPQFNRLSTNKELVKEFTGKLSLLESIRDR